MKHKTRLIWQIYPAILFLLCFSLLVVLIYVAYSIKMSYTDATQQSLESKVLLLERMLLPSARIESLENLNDLCKNIGTQINTRITIIAMPSGEVLCDSESDPAKMDNHAGRDEISRAYQTGHDAHSQRFSATIGKQLIYYGHPVKDASGKTEYILRIAIQRADFNEFLSLYDTKIIIAAIIVLLFSAAAGFLISKRITEPINNIRQIVAGFARGELDQKIQQPDTMELADLADATNQMALQLKSRIEAIENQKSQLSAILASMSEAVLALDNGLVITEVNSSAIKLMGLPPLGCFGMTIFEAVRNTGIHDLAAKTLAAETTTEANITLSGPNDTETHIQAHGTRIQGAD